MPGTSAVRTTATATVVVRTSPKARRLIGRTFFHSSRGELRYAAENRIGGRNTQQDDLRFERDARRAGDEAEDEAADDHEDRVGHADPSRDDRQQRDDGEQEDDGLDRFHRGQA